MNRRLAAVLAVLALALVFAAPAAAEKSIIIGLASDALFLDPSQQDETITNTMGRYMYDGLLNNDAQGIPSPALAESWSVGDDNLTWTFNLRKGVTFHDGTAFTAEDVAYTIEVCRTSLLKNFTSSIKEVQVVDPHTVKIVTNAPTAILLESLVALRILPKEYRTKLGETAFNQAPMGTGPYIFEEWIKEDHISMKANENYWGGAPKIKKITMRPISNAATRTAALLTGEVDIIEDVPVRDVAKVKSTEGIEVVDRPSERLIYLHVDSHRAKGPGIIDLDKNPLADIRVRKALSLAINRDSIVKMIMNGNAYATNQMVLKGRRGYVEDMPEAKYDPEEAKKLLTEAGYPDGFKVYLDAPNGRYPNDGQVAQALASQLTKAGILVELRLHPKSTFFDFVRPGDKSSLVMTGWSEPIDVGEMASVLFYTRGKNPAKGGSNRGHYANAEFDSLIDEADGTADPDKRRLILEKAARLIVEDVGIVPLYFQQDLYGKKSSVVFEPRVDKSILAYEMDVQ
ncbi:ABC transporter substrate-binding protein [Aminivibrio sp.]|jgi:peptide/nickel transport system substrate-binding protein|uniref:ABC transporter substrate-binding protein n=1 Tax=Aminivibrio sp. TaxID=1872489 RepID=UPI0016B56611|nr:ABC transporter substrate-binding protein [Synergistaceae bacterium]MDD4612116.1 ABC transporter substrate-binding protein [Synergistaceae bacterium]NLO57929.1 ABC transporter substrate-binding protein [Synergistaceae bacterium]